MLFHAIEDHTSDAYFQQTVMDIEGYVDPAILEASFNDIMKRHEILRICISIVGRRSFAFRLLRAVLNDLFQAFF